MGKYGEGLRGLVETKCGVCKKKFMCIRLRLLNSKNGKVCCSSECWYVLKRQVVQPIINAALTVKRFPVECTYCGGDIMVTNPKRTHRKYCSRECYFKSKIDTAIYKCIICNATLEHRGRYCSEKCRYESIRRQYIIKRKDRVYFHFSCPWCSKDVSVCPARVPNKTGNHFCNQKCYIKWFREIGVGIVRSKNEKRKNAPPNIPEGMLLKLVKPLGFKYTGNGKFIVGKYNPDFVHQKLPLIIEFFGEYWHEDNDVFKKRYYFGKYGYSCLVIWQKQLNKSPQRVVNRVKAFISKAA